MPHSAHGVPRVMYTFWDSERPPPFVAACLDNWAAWNPGWRIVLLHRGNARDHTGGVDPFAARHADSPQRISDYVRLLVLAEHGGVWCDASMLMRARLDELLAAWEGAWYGVGTQGRAGPHAGPSGPVRAGFYAYWLRAFTTRDEAPVIESWWFAAARGNTFMRAWRDEFVDHMGSFPSVDAYVADAQARGVDLQTIFPHLRSYLAIHVAAQAVLQGRNGQRAGAPPASAAPARPARYALALRAADDPDGALGYLAAAKWKSRAAVDAIWAARAPPPGPLIKFRGSERAPVEAWDAAKRARFVALFAPPT